MGRKQKSGKHPAATQSAASPGVSPGLSAPPQEKFGLSYCILGAVVIVCAMFLTFRMAMNPNSPRFLGIGDSWSYYGPTLSFLDHALHKEHELPLWNPFFFCGQPHAANPQSFVFYPPNLLRSLLTFNPTPLKTHAGIALMVLAQTVAAGLGMLFLARRHRYSYGAALLAAFAFPFSGALVSRAIGHWIFLNSACWLPWVLLLANETVHGRGGWRRATCAALAGLLYGCCILGGVPVITFLGGVLLGAYWLMEVLGKGVQTFRGAHGVPMRSRLASLAAACLADGLLFGAIMLFSVLLAAPMLLPLREFAAMTGRQGLTASVEDFAPLAYGWTLIKVLVFYEGHAQYEGIRGGGAAVVCFALLAVLLKPRWNGLRWVALFLMLLDLSVSQPVFVGRLTRIVAPFLSNNPGRGMVIGALPLAMLAGWGLDALLKASSSRRRAIWATAMAVAVGGVVLCVLCLAAQPGMHAVRPVEAILPAAALAAALLGLWLREHLLTGIVVAMLVLGEILAWNQALLPDLMRKENLYPSPLEYLAAKKSIPNDNRRATDPHPNVRLYDLQFSMNGYDPLHLKATRSVLSPIRVQPNNYLIRSVEARETTSMSRRGFLFPKRRFWLTEKYCKGPLPGHAHLYPATGITFLSGASDLPVPSILPGEVPETSISIKGDEVNLLAGGVVQKVTQEIMKDPSTAILVGKTTLNRRHGAVFLTFSGQGGMTVIPAFKDADTGVIELGSRQDIKLQADTAQTLEFPMPDYDRVEIYLRVQFTAPAREVLLTGAKAILDAGDENDHIQITRQTANEAAVKLVDLPGPRVLLFVDSFYPGWKAFLDGKEVPILRANNVFKAVIAPAGTHEVRFVFSSVRVTIGIILAGLALAATCALGLAGWRRRKPAPAETCAGDCAKEDNP